ncbi:putative uncharacterized protein [Parachlamydia acanthamoebae UV-7]|uniref:Uncharacterized protein n=2 Tax=Parachlamydia acanthamoebae TaxID=83552 RepID=F8KVY7_PARAV|nr:hypothetical protein [Parachlamydia acanthamoebae]KIA76256.1 hypothetical protein DB43_AP00120 [Parachlamydia acanthamoebae]CCB85286.1 putative uncharacterized protein [Parachlamydia acanthamoebae UV-7]
METNLDPPLPRFPWKDEDLLQHLTDLPTELLEHTLSFLHPGHPLNLEHEIQKAYHLIKESDQSQLDHEAISKTVTCIWKRLKKYQAITLLYRQIPQMEMIWAAFAQKFPLLFEIEQRLKIRKLIAETISHDMLNDKWQSHLWYPLVSLKRPSKNVFGTVWKDIDPSFETRLLKPMVDKLQDFIGAHIYSKTREDPQPCDCCQSMSKINVEIDLEALIFNPFADMSLQSILSQSVPPAEVHPILVDKIIQIIQNWQSLQKLSEPYSASKGNLNHFIRFLQNELQAQIDKILQLRLPTEVIPTCTADIPDVLKTLQSIQISSTPDSSIVSQIGEYPASAHICVLIKVRNFNDRTDEISWANHPHCLKGIVDLAIKLLNQGYHVKLS